MGNVLYQTTGIAANSDFSRSGFRAEASPGHCAGAGAGARAGSEASKIS